MNPVKLHRPKGLFRGILFLLLFVTFCMPAAGLKAQTPGTLDPGFDGGTGFVNNSVAAIIPLAEGKMLIGGNFIFVRGAERNRVARLNADGTVDESFDPGTGANATVNSIAVQSDGKVLIGGDFTSFNGTARNCIARLNADGSLDTSFNPGTGANNPIYTLAVQGDGKVLIGGSFTSYDGTARNRIARLHADGSLDTSFNPGTGANNPVYTLALQSDGKVLIGGEFGSYNNTNRNRIARLNTDGSLDTSFDPGTGVNSAIDSLVSQSDGKVLIGGRFSNFNGTARNRIARLNANGSLDTSFDPGTGASDTVYFVTVQSDGKVLIGGGFFSYNNTSRPRIARLNIDGSLDTSFDPGTGASHTVSPIAAQSDGKVLIGGNFTSFNGVPRSRLARLNADGSLDTSFNPSSGAIGGNVRTVAVQSDGKVLIGGTFTSYHGTARLRIARLNANGSLDTSFDPGTGVGGSGLVVGDAVHTIAVQSDGKVLVGGEFFGVSGASRPRIARLNADGSLDTSFDPGTGASDRVYSMAVQSDGKVIIGGEFTSFNGTARNRIARLNTDGSLDTSFDPGTGGDASIFTVALQGDGKLLIGGWFMSYNGIARNRIARLNADGSLDASFDPGTGANDTVNSVAVQSDGKVMIGGSFTSINGTARNRIARLNANGSIDASFDPGIGTGGGVNSLAVQSDGKVLIGGGFTSANGAARNRIARLNANGSLDTSFDPGTGASDIVTSVAVQGDGKVLIGGGFTGFNGAIRFYLTRLENDPAIQSLTAPDSGRVEWLRSGASPEVQDVSFELSINGGGTWALLGTAARISGGWELTGLSLPVSGQIRARARTNGGYFNGSSGLVETVRAFAFAPIPVATSGTVTNITRTSADLSGTVDPKGAETTVVFQTRCGTEAYTPAGNVVAAQSPLSAGTEPVAVSATRTGLLPGTTYEFNIATGNSSGAGEWSQSVSFTTLPNTAPVAADRQLVTPPVAVPTVIFDVALHASDADGDALTVSIVNGASTSGSATTDGKTVTFTSTALVRSVTLQLEVSDGFITIPVSINLSPVIPVATSGTATNITRTSADLSGTVNPNGAATTVVFQTRRVPEAYTPAGNVAAAQSPVPAGTEPVVVSATKTGLLPGTTYEFNIISNNSVGTGESSQSVSFTTLPNTAPVAAERQIAAPPVAVPTVIFDVAQHASDADGDALTVSILNGASAFASATTDGKTVTFNSTALVRSVTVQLEVSDGFVTVPVNVTLTLADSVRSTIASKGGLVPAAGEDPRIPAGSVWASFGVPSINDSGAVAFLGNVKASPSFSAIFAGEPSALALLARKGLEAPGAGGALFASFRDPLLSNAGEVAFLGTLTGSGVTSKNKHGIWRAAPAPNGEGYALELLARAGQEAPGVPRAKWKSFISVLLHGDAADPASRSVVALATLVTGSNGTAGPGGVTAANNLGLWRFDENGARLLLRKGQALQVRGAATTVRSFVALSSVSGSPSHGRVSAAQGALIRAKLADGRSALLQADASSLSVLAVTGEEIEPGTFLASLGIPSGDLEGASVAKVLLTGGSVTSATETAIALFSKEGSEGLIYRTGLDASSSGGPQVKSFLDPVVNLDGEAFLATLAGVGVTKDSNTAIFWQDNESLKMLAREGAEPIGVDGAEWASFTSLALPDGSGPLFTAKLRVGPGGVTSTNDVGLWGVDGAGTLRLLIREGESNEAGILKKFTILSAVSGSPAQRRSYNAHGALIYRAYFTDKSQALIQVQLP